MCFSFLLGSAEGDVFVTNVYPSSLAASSAPFFIGFQYAPVSTIGMKYSVLSLSLLAAELPLLQPDANRTIVIKIPVKTILLFLNIFIRSLFVLSFIIN